MKKKDVRAKDRGGINRDVIVQRRIKRYYLKGWRKDPYYKCKKCGRSGFVHDGEDGFVACPHCDVETTEIMRFFYLKEKRKGNSS